MTENHNLSQTWKTPNELIKLHRFELRKRALTARLNKKLSNTETEPQIDLSPICVVEKRKNPFAKENNTEPKKQKIDVQSYTLSTEDSLLQLIDSTKNQNIQEKIKLKNGLQPFDAQNFSSIFNEIPSSDGQNECEDQQCSENLPIDWSLKSRIRILCETSLPASNLKTNQEASALTGFVRCLDRNNSSNNLDLSFGARFNQGAHYWQHPHLPWLTLFPRNAKSNIGFQLGEKERECLAKDWTDSFRGLFQLLRARQCPFFYLCANTFTVLFRAGGVGGIVETHALMSPTSRGIRAALKQEEIVYSMVLKENKDENFSNSFEEKNKNDDNENENSCNNDDDDDDEDEDEKWLESLGVDEKEIRKINSTRAREKLIKEIAEDFSDNSIVLIEGVECQAFFNFLLNAKSTIANVGRLAGVPPTLLSSVAFPKATMQTLSTRSSKVRNDGAEYFSIELKGCIMPHVLPYINSLLCETKDAFSVTLAPHANTLAFTKASQKLIDDIEKKNSISDEVFGKENLSDCGLQNDIVESMCKIKKNSVSIIDRMCFSKQVGFIWS